MQRTFRVGKSTMVPRAFANHFLKGGVVFAETLASDSILDAEILEVI